MRNSCKLLDIGKVHHKLEECLLDFLLRLDPANSGRQDTVTMRTDQPMSSAPKAEARDVGYVLG